MHCTCTVRLIIMINYTIMQHSIIIRERHYSIGDREGDDHLKILSNGGREGGSE